MELMFAGITTAAGVALTATTVLIGFSASVFIATSIISIRPSVVSIVAISSIPVICLLIFRILTTFIPFMRAVMKTARVSQILVILVSSVCVFWLHLYSCFNDC